ncbi:hypothetical protein H2203_005231 [Taxawa tesnikishii (nom. ined.)]|nr:hypothetical protein H2203_005231 [Dothideales sp. JES 119]
MVPNSFYSTMDLNTRIACALDDLESQERVNYAASARKWNIDRRTLARRHKGETDTIQQANSNVRQKLTNAQEEVLVAHLNRLTDGGLPPTPQVLKNIAEQVAKTKLERTGSPAFTGDTTIALLACTYE